MTGVALAIWLILSLVITVPTPTAGSYNSFPIYLYVIWFVKGLGMSFVHVNSFPMVVELCSSKKIGQFTGFYYASSMAAQTVTPCLLGLLLLTPGFSFNLLPLYALVCIALATVIFFFVKNIKANKVAIKTGLDALGTDDE